MCSEARMFSVGMETPFREVNKYLRLSQTDLHIQLLMSMHAVSKGSNSCRSV